MNDDGHSGPLLLTTQSQNHAVSPPCARICNARKGLQHKLN